MKKSFILMLTVGAIGVLSFNVFASAAPEVTEPAMQVETTVEAAVDCPNGGICEGPGFCLNNEEGAQKGCGAGSCGNGQGLRRGNGQGMGRGRGCLGSN